MDEYKYFYADKASQTFADILIAFGLARIVDELLREQTKGGRNVLIQDKGPYYQLTCTPALERSTVEALRELSLLKVIVTVKNRDKLPADLPSYLTVDYEQERERVSLFFAARKAGSNGSTLPERPHPHWDIFKAINAPGGPLIGYNSLALDWWAIRQAHSQVLLLLLDLYSDTPNDYETAENRWKELDKQYGWGIKAQATCQQLYNPDQGKGQNRSKADALSIGNQSALWLAEWLKAVGFYEAALTRQMRGAKDRKTFVVAPRELTFSENQAIMNRFVDKMQVSESPTRFDILAALRYASALLEYFTAEPGGLARLLGLQQVKKRVVAGFRTAFYKDLGNATATMNLAFVALPGWVEVHSREEVDLYIALLSELESFVRQFDESHSDAFTLLQHLRDFVSGDDLDAFFRFTNAFPAYLIGRREQNKYARQLTTEFIERLVMSTEKRLTRILESQGFQNIAYAIRQSTVTAQYRKKQGDRKYDVRYGLGQELARKARYPESFIAALSDFLHKYNAENAQVMENRSGPYRRSVKTTDIDEIAALIDEFGSETVANLLIAYGYAREPYEAEPGKAEAKTPEITDEEEITQ
ncbi:MAG: hypothetical protein KBH93_02600 [Anaerolineae bacterium]|nr:hypothetical protein [Anaerolineae bacterium]